MFRRTNLEEWERLTKNIALMVSASPKSKKQIALEAGIAPTTLSQYCYGKVYPSVVTLKKLCQVLDCNYEDILGRL